MLHDGGMSTRRAGLLVIRAWFEEGSARPLRATVRVTADVAAGLQQAITFTDAESVCRAVEEWLRGLGDAADDAIGDAPGEPLVTVLPSP